jgi:hypothetical protein
MRKNENRKMLFQKAKGKSLISIYLKELNLLTRQMVEAKDLITIEDTVRIIHKRKEISNTIPFEKLTLSFEAKDRLSSYLAKMAEIKKGKVYLFTEYSKNCGALLLNSLNDFNHKFSFNDEHSGIISFLSEDLKDKLVLDFYVENDKYILELETQGFVWNSVLYNNT